MRTPGEREWLRVRSFLQENRYQLAVAAAGEYPDAMRVASTPLLAAAAWRPGRPVPLAGIRLEFAAADPVPEYSPLLPERADGGRYARYSDVVRELAAPAVFENRRTYRLLAADLRARPPRLAFGPGRYFDGIDVGEAAAAEFAARRLGGDFAAAAVSGRLGDPCDLGRRPANLAITTLTIRHDRASGAASFLLHWRDPAKVGHAGGLYQVVPVGIFQPSGESAADDFSLWLCMIREFAEELAGQPEEYASPVDYAAWPFARRLNAAVDDGRLRVWCLGLGTDPLTYATDLLTVAVFDSDVFDAMFGVVPRDNAEGRVLALREFDGALIERLVAGEPVQAAGAAVLRLAWRHRERLLYS